MNLRIKCKTLLATVVALCVFLSACQYAIPNADPESTNPETESTSMSINTELISNIGKPFKYFSEKYGWNIRDLDIRGEGPPVGEYIYSNEIYTFNNPLGYAALTGETPCTAVETLYTALLPGAATLTNEKLIEIFVEYSDETLSYGYLDVCYDNTIIRFYVRETGEFKDYISININWDSSLLPNTGINTELISHIGKPFNYFSEKYGWALEDLDVSGDGQHVGYHATGEARFTFRNRTGASLTAETPCTEIVTLYTTFMPAIKNNRLTEENITEIVGNYTEEHLSDGYLAVYLDNAIIRFYVKTAENIADYVFEPYIHIENNWQVIEGLSGASTLTPEEITPFLNAVGFSDETWNQAEKSLHPTLLFKAMSSLHYHDGYFSMAYEGLDGYAASDLKRTLINSISEGWDNDSDPAAEKLKKAVRSNKYFSEAFVETLIKASYTYSYHAFAEQYGVRPNRTYADSKDVQFAASEDGDFGWYYTAAAESYLNYDECQFYELDFDGDGLDELGVPCHSGAGGAFMADGFAVFKKNEDGFYQFYGSGPDCAMRDAMRAIQYNGRIYFITNPFSDDMSALHDINAFTLDDTGARCQLFITCTDYELRRIAAYTDEAYTSGFNGLLTNIEMQMREAVAATKRYELYCPGDEDIVSSEGGEHYGDGLLYTDPQDVFFAADIDNDGTVNIIHKGHKILQSKYYDDCYLFQAYKNHEDFADNTVSIRDYELRDDFYGLHSDGNIYDLLPVTGKIVQLWTHEHDGSIYTAALTRQQLLYTLHVYLIQDGKTNLVSHSLFFDEVQDMEAALLEDE